MTNGEKDHLLNIYRKIKRLRNFLISNELDSKSTNPDYWYQYLTGIKQILGNFDNDISFVACLMAKEFLMKMHCLDVLDVSLKPQSAPGFDIDVTTIKGERIIAEIKTIIPYGKTDLGAQQKKMFLKDIEKLVKEDSKYKYLFVTEKETFEIVKKRYIKYMGCITLVLLPQGLHDSTYIVTSSLYVTSQQRLSDRIRSFICKEFITPAKTSGRKYIRIRSGDVHSKMELKNRYPAVCSVMRGKKLEQLCHVKIIRTEGSDGANFYVTYELQEVA